MRIKLTDLHVRVATEIRQRHLFPPRTNLLVAVSGGQDSMCLLKILLDLTPRWQGQVFVLHCDHRWTPEETDCAQQVYQWVTDLGLPCAIETADPITLDEDRARRWRYQVLGRWAQRWNCATVVTGHTGSDRAETILFNLMRGTGVQGLQSLDWQRPLDRTQPNSPSLVRPLLTIWRQETAAFCQAQGWPIWPDRTNQDLTHARNRLRQDVIPYLKHHFNPQVELSLTRTAAILSAEHEFVSAQAQALWPRVYQPDPPRLHQFTLRQHPLALQRRIFHRFLQERLGATPRFDQVERLVHLLQSPRRARTPHLPGGGWVEVGEDWLVWRVPQDILCPAAPPLGKGLYDSAIDLT